MWKQLLILIHFSKRSHMEEKNIIDDLIQVNNDRVAGYLKAAEQLDDPRLKNLLTAKVVQSRLFIYQLRQRTNTAGYSNEQNSRSSGHIYNTWKNLNPTFGCSDSKASLESFEYGEDGNHSRADKSFTTITGRFRSQASGS